ncbi:MAG: nucleotidyltransferase family protein [Candidatus Eisenbacteria bacterium]
MEPKAERVGAIVLAAGYSSRIGRPKALLPLGRTTCLSFVLAACGEAGLRRVHVVVGHRGGEIAAAVARAGAEVVWNDRFPEGQLASLQAGIRSLPGDLAAALLLPVDHPLVRSSTIRRLIQAFQEETKGRTVFLPTLGGEDGRPYLVCSSILPEFLSLPSGALGRTVIRRDPARVREVPVDDEGVRFDLDTPDDYVLLRAKLRPPSGP